MKYNTRFNPTPTGPLHIGHLYNALVNYTEAKKSGGEFFVRIDDTQPYWNNKLGLQVVSQLVSEYRVQLGKFMDVSNWQRQSLLPDIDEIINGEPFLQFIPKAKWFHELNVEWIPDRDLAMYPCTPMLTFEKVLWDFESHVNWLIRGEDLATETSLYDYYTQVIGLPPVRHTLIPRLRAGDKNNLQNSIISKTKGEYLLQDQIDRYGVDEIVEMLKMSCLINTNADFTVDNVKCNPIITGFTT